MHRGSNPFDLDPSEIADRLDFIGFDEEDADRIRACRATLHSHTADLAEDLYTHIRTIPALDQILAGHLNQCRVKQSAYLRQLLNATVDRLYTAARTWIGEVHRHMGVEPRWYLGAYCYLQDQIAQVLEESDLDTLEAWRAHRSLLKLVVFDVSLALEAYERTAFENEHRRGETLREHALPTILEVERGVLVLPVAGGLDAERVMQLEGSILQALLSREEVRALVIEASHLWLEEDTLVLLASLLQGTSIEKAQTSLAGLSSDPAVLDRTGLGAFPTYPTLAEALDALRA